MLSRTSEPELALYLKYQKALLPELTQWNHLIGGEYICGLEPGNASMKGRAWHREQGSLEELPGGGKRKFSIEIGVVQGRENVNELLGRLGHEVAGGNPAAKRAKH